MTRSRVIRSVGILGVSLLAGGLAGCALRPQVQAPTVAQLTLPTQILVKSGGRIVPVPLDEYVTASVLTETSPLNETGATVDRVLQVQSIVARTYAAYEVGRHRSEGFDLCDTTHCQLYEPGRIKTSRFAAAAAAATLSTRGQVLTYRGRIVEALFHADCGGYTTGADAVWGGAVVPYLLAAPDAVEPVTHKLWQVTLPIEKLRAALNADPRTIVGRRLTSVAVRARDVSGRAADIAIDGEFSPLVRSDDFRAALNTTLGDRAIRSTLFTLKRTDTSYIFSGAGFGHGVGLCQIGAMARARRGDAPGEILSHYFPAAQLTQLR